MSFKINQKKASTFISTKTYFFNTKFYLHRCRRTSFIPDRPASMCIQEEDTIVNLCGGSKTVVGVLLGLPDKLMKYSLKSIPYGTASCTPSFRLVALSIGAPAEHESPPLILCFGRFIRWDSFTKPLLALSLFIRFGSSSSEIESLLIFRLVLSPLGASSLKFCNKRYFE